MIRSSSSLAWVVEQARAVYRTIDRDRRAIGAERFHDLAYEELCADSHATLARLADDKDLAAVAKGASDAARASSAPLAPSAASMGRMRASGTTSREAVPPNRPRTSP